MKVEERKMKNSEHFGELTSRMNHFREEVLDKKPYICAKRALLATEAYKEHLNEPPIMKKMCIRDRLQCFLRLPV